MVQKAEPLVINFLKTHTFQELEDCHGVVARFANGGTKAALNYDQLSAKSDDLLACQCRGLVIGTTTFNRNDVGDTWKDVVVGETFVIGRPLDRFFNMGDIHGAPINWTCRNLKVFEKLDGTMIVLYWDPQKNVWCAGTRGVPEADLPVKSGNLDIGDATFSDLFFDALRVKFKLHNGRVLDPSFDLDRDLTYVFEFTSVWNRVVVKYDTPSVTLLAVRSNKTGEEIRLEDVQLDLPRPKTWAISDPVALRAFVDSNDPAQLEGVVVCDGAFNRLKVKNSLWSLLSRAKDMLTTSRRSALEAVVLGKTDDIVPFLDSDQVTKIEAMKLGLLTFCKRTDDTFKQFVREADGSRKDFANLVTSSDAYTPVMFSLLDKKANTTLDWLASRVESKLFPAAMADAILKRIDEITTPCTQTAVGR